MPTSSGRHGHIHNQTSAITDRHLPRARNNSMHAHAPRATKQAGRLPRSLAACTALIFLTVGGAYAGYLYRNSEAIQKYLNPLLRGSSIEAAFPGKESLNLMIVGRDCDYDNKDRVIKSHARSDVLMVAHLDFARHAINILSIPRDTRAHVPGHGYTKINAAHAFGGPSLTASTVSENFGIPMDNYVALDFDGFKKAIDILGGVDCNVDKRMDYDDNWGNLHIHLSPGKQHLTGAQAVGFARFRHSDSDLVRTRRQQELISDLKVALMQPQTLTLIPKVLDVLDRNIDSDLTPNQRIAVALFARKVPRQCIAMDTVPSAIVGNSVEADWTRTAPIVKEWFGVDVPERAHYAIYHRRARRHRIDLART